MIQLRLLSRVAFLFNICFLIVFSAGYVRFLTDGIVSSTLIIMGNVLSIVVNIVVNLLIAGFLLAGKSLQRFVPKGLIIINFLFLIVQLILLVK